MRLALVVIASAACGKQFNYDYCKGHPGEYPDYCGRDAGLDAPADALPDAPPGFHYVGGMVSGLVSGTSVTLQLNGANDLVETQNTAYLFPQSLMEGKPYTVTVKTQPLGSMCTLANATGTLGTTDVTNVNVMCTAYDPGVRCGPTFCTSSSATPICCASIATCTPTGSCAAEAMSCDDTADCVPMGSSFICCGKINGGSQPTSAVCETAANCTQGEILCDPGAPGGDPACSGKTCLPAAHWAGYYSCQ